MKVTINTGLATTVRWFLDPVIERARLRERFGPVSPALSLHLGMLRAFEAGNVGRMHQIASIMRPSLLATQHETILEILATPEDDDTIVEITEGGEDWAICRKYGLKGWEVVVGPGDLETMHGIEYRAATPVQVAIVHLPTGTPEYFWTEIKNPGTSPWWRWTEAPFVLV